MYWGMLSHHPTLFLSSPLSLVPRIYRMFIVFIVTALISFCFMLWLVCRCLSTISCGGLVSPRPLQELSNSSGLKPVFCVVGWG